MQNTGRALAQYCDALGPIRRGERGREVRKREEAAEKRKRSLEFSGKV